MKTTLMDNFIAGSRTSFAASDTKTKDIEIVTTRKEKPEFDVHREINNRAFIRPLPPKGHIIKSNILTAPRDFYDDVTSDINALKSAWKGNANDHQLGKLNDFGMKLGGLTIAAYLFSMRHTPITKAMEFVGLGSFFASMAIWPKIALDIPARLIKGFSPFMRYEDSQGRKKRFFADNKYIPFDMISDKEIHKIGNRLGIPKNQINRREAVEDKMRQIALQNNTMWMLTAGFATPVMSSLMCNFLEPYVDDAYNYLLNKRINNIMEHFADESKKFKMNDVIKNVDEVLALHNDAPVTKEIIQDIANAMTTHLGPTVKKGLLKDLDSMFISGTYRLNETNVGAIKSRIETMLTETAGNKIAKEQLAIIIPTEEQITTVLSGNGYFSKPLNQMDIYNVLRDINEIVINNMKAADSLTEDSKIPEFVKNRLSNSIMSAKNKKNQNILETVLKSNPADVLDVSGQQLIRQLAKSTTKLNAEHAAINVYAYSKLAQAPNTAKAKFWNDTVKSIVKTLKITPKEIENTRYDRKLVGELINKKIWQFATADTEEYKKFVIALASEINKLESDVKYSDFTEKFVDQAKKSYSTAADELRSAGFTNMADRLIRQDGKEVGTLFGITKTFVSGNLTNLSATFSSIINKANTYRTIYKDPDLAKIGAQNLPKEVKEEIVALIEYLTTEGRISDYSVKFDFLRNPEPNKSLGKLEINPKTGIKYGFYDAEKRVTDGVIIKSDIGFFRNTMRTLFETPTDIDTQSALTDFYKVGELLQKYRQNMLTVVANIENFMYPEHVMKVFKDGSHSIISDKTYTSVTPKERSNMVGAALDEVFTNTLKQSYNTRKWLKMFGGFGAGLFGFTVFSQFLFGHGKVRSVNNNNNVNKGKV